MGLGVRLAAWAVVALAAGVVAEWAYARAGASAADVARDLSVGWAFAGAGLVARWRRPANPTGALMLAEGLTWFLGNLQGTAVPALFAVGAWFEALNLAVLAHLVLAYPEGRLPTRVSRWVVGVGYGLVAVAGLARVTLFDPAVSSWATYLSCSTRCGPNALLLHHDPELFEAVDAAYRGLGAVLTAVVLVELARRWRAASPARRRVLLPAWLSVLLAMVFIGWGMLHVLTPGTIGAVERLLALLSDLSQVAVPLAFLAGLLRMRLRRAAVGNLVIEVGANPTPRRLQEVLARVTGDPSLRLGVWAPSASAYLDVDGAPLPPPAEGAGRAVTLVDRGGEPAAVLIHDPGLDEDPELLAAVAASLRLGLENTWLREEVTARLEQVRAAGSRIVEAADRERRRLERDLHDGAQTRLVFALMTLRRLDARLAKQADDKLRLTVREADRTLRVALDELRDLARGIHPALLTREGIGPAVSALAEQAAMPVVVMVEPGRYPSVIEATAYFTVCEALSNAAKHADARAVSVWVRREGERLVVEAVDDGAGGADLARGTGLRGLADRVTAVGGELRVVSPVGGGTTVRAELPVEVAVGRP
ncbi:hypothetical protein GCM10027168_32720 [Streptomyces capparidis]